MEKVWKGEGGLELDILVIPLDNIEEFLVMFWPFCL